MKAGRDFLGIRNPETSRQKKAGQSDEKPIRTKAFHGAQTSVVQPMGGWPALGPPGHRVPDEFISVNWQNMPTGSLPSTIGVDSLTTQGAGANEIPVNASG